MFLVVVKDDLNIVRHQVAFSMLHLAERKMAQFESACGDNHFVEIHKVKVLTGLDIETFYYPVEIVKEQESEALGFIPEKSGK